MATVKYKNNCLFKNVRIHFPGSTHHGKICHIAFKDGIPSITSNQEITDQESVDMSGCILVPGLFDLRTSFREPGYEEDETFESGSLASARGGFTSVALSPDTMPVADNSSIIEFLVSKGDKAPIHVHPIGSVSLENKGKEMAEMYDMAGAGAVAFSDHKKPLENPHLLMRSLIYAKGFNKTIIQIPDTSALSNNGKMHEGVTSTLNGLKGIPSLSETLMVKRDLDIAAFYDCSIHLGGISADESVKAIREAKSRGVKVTADVHAINLFFTDEALANFDSSLKVKPPLRTEADRQALIEGLKDGTLDAICSDHNPRNPEQKIIEFDLAAFGASQAETAFLQVYEMMGPENLDMILEKMALSPRRILNLDLPIFEEGKPTEVMIFNPGKTFTYKTENKLSKSANSPLLNHSFPCTVEAIACKNKVVLFG